MKICRRMPKSFCVICEKNSKSLVMRICSKKRGFAGIYSRAQTSYHARIAFHRWIKLAEETSIPELRTMAKTLRDKIEGIISFWTFRHISNASMEGFNNKIRWLIKQAYGFRDSEYFKLKIYQLPEISSVKEL